MNFFISNKSKSAFKLLQTAVVITFSIIIFYLILGSISDNILDIILTKAINIVWHFKYMKISKM
jgi:hypothetical protein